MEVQDSQEVQDFPVFQARQAELDQLAIQVV
jgi:hypothetical protein